MNRDELKQHITDFRLNLPKDVKFAVIAQSTAVLESAKDLHCEYLYVAMERTGYSWARVTYGETENRLEGSWVGNSWLKVYPCYDEEHLVMVDGVPCQYVGETNPFQDDPMLERPVPNILDYLRPEASEHTQKAKSALVLSSRNVDVADAVGDYLGGESLVDAFIRDSVESRSASKALLGQPDLSKTPHQLQAWKHTPLSTLEYRVRKFDWWQLALHFSEDLRRNRQNLNSASLANKVAYKRTYHGMQTTHAAEGDDQPIVESMFHLRSKAVILRPKLDTPEPFKFRDVITKKEDDK